MAPAATLPVDDPYSGETFAEVPLATAREAETALARAARAQAEWAGVPVAGRVAAVERFVDRFLARAEQVATDLTGQMGKPAREARAEVRTMADRARVLCALAPAALSDEEIPGPAGWRRVIRHEPAGVVLDIAPWNYPLLTAVNFVVPAVLAGDAVIVKPSSRTPLSGAPFSRAFAEAGAPDGLVQDLACDHAVAEALIADPRVGFVAFTGSVEGGRRVYRSAAARLIDCGLELGGKDPAYLRPDADLSAAAGSLAEGAFYNAGQSCCAVERIYAHRDIYRRFLEALVEAAHAFRPGDPRDPATTLGPMAQPDAPTFLRSQVVQAEGQGARVLCGGLPEAHHGRGRFFAPTVVADATHTMAIMTEESFGPVVGVAPVAGDDEAVALINDSRYGLSASLWTADADAAAALAARVSAGTVYLNRCDYLDPRLPWSGRRDSGVGCSLSHHGLLAVTRPKSLLLRTP